MVELKAVEIAHEYLCNNIKLELCVDAPSGIYNVKHTDDDYLFAFSLFGGSGIGSSEYVSVSKSSGDVRYLGFLGE